MIKPILDGLAPEQKKRLMYAFEHGLSQFVEHRTGEFIGVNVFTIKHLEVVEQAGSWAIGKLKGKV